MIIFALSAFFMADHPNDPSLNWPSPPEEMIDFLGRRRLCLELPDGPRRNPFVQSEWDRLSCATLNEEEAGWRSRITSNRDILLWLDQNPREFRMPVVEADLDSGPPPADAHRLVLTGTDEVGRSSFRLSIDRQVNGGRHTRLTASYGGVPPQTFVVENRRFARLDLQTVSVAYGGDPPHQLIVRVRFGHPRGYCSLLEGDDRPVLDIGFSRDAIRASYQDRTNCDLDYLPLDNAND